MTTLRILLLPIGVGLVLALSQAARAEPECPAGALGVSRTIEGDAAKGPTFGEPTGDPNFLARGEVVLTFDDGPMPKYTRPILAALAAQCVKATFFNVGEMAAEFPDVVKEVVAQGHTVGGHTWSHVNLKRISEERAKIQVESAFTAIEKAAGAPIAPFFRFPYLADSKPVAEYLASRHIATFAIDVDSLDWRTRDPGTIVRRVMSGLERRGRGIVLMHDIHASTMAAVPMLLTQLKAKGFKIAHLKAAAPLVTLKDAQPPVKASARDTAEAGRARTHRVVRHRTPPVTGSIGL